MYANYFKLRGFDKTGPHKIQNVIRFIMIKIVQLILAYSTKFFYIISGIAHICMGSMNSDL